MGFQDLLYSLESYGIFDVVLPFLLVFTLVFASLNKVQLLGGKKNIDSIVALAISLLAVRNVYFIEFLNRFLPNTAMFLVIILIGLLIFSMLTKRTELVGAAGFVAVLITLVFLIWAVTVDYLGGGGSGASYFGYGGGGLYDLWSYMDEQTRYMIAAIAGIVVVIALAGGFGGDDTKSFFEKLGEGFDKTFKGGRV